MISQNKTPTLCCNARGFRYHAKKRRHRGAAKFREETSKKAAEQAHAAAHHIRQYAAPAQAEGANVLRSAAM